MGFRVWVFRVLGLRASGLGLRVQELQRALYGDFVPGPPKYVE